MLLLLLLFFQFPDPGDLAGISRGRFSTVVKRFGHYVTFSFMTSLLGGRIGYPQNNFVGIKSSDAIPSYLQTKPGFRARC